MSSANPLAALSAPQLDHLKATIAPNFAHGNATINFPAGLPHEVAPMANVMLPVFPSANDELLLEVVDSVLKGAQANGLDPYTELKSFVEAIADEVAAQPAAQDERPKAAKRLPPSKKKPSLAADVVEELTPKQVERLAGSLEYAGGPDAAAAAAVAEEAKHQDDVSGVAAALRNVFAGADNTAIDAMGAAVAHNHAHVTQRFLHDFQAAAGPNTLNVEDEVEAASVPRADAMRAVQRMAHDERDMVRDAFILIDADGDGFISPDDVREAVQARLTPEAFSDVEGQLTLDFQQADFDHDDRLGLLEFTASFAVNVGVLPHDVLLSCVTHVRARLTGAELRVLHENFRHGDLDNDGYLSHYELHALLADAFAPDLDEEDLQACVRAAIAAADRDGDGKLNASEFVRSFQEEQNVLPPTLTRTVGELIQAEYGLAGDRLAEAVLACVEDSVRLARPELKRVLTAELIPVVEQHITPEGASRIAARVANLATAVADRDEQGAVNMDTFRQSLRIRTEELDTPRQAAGGALQAAAVARRERYTQVFRALDVDHDGFLRRCDIVPLMTRLLREQQADLEDEVVTQTCGNVFDAADADEDGHLSQEEFVHSFAVGAGVLPEDFITRVTTSAGKPLGPREMELVSAAFKALDGDQDGFVSPEDLSCGLKKALEPDVDADRVADIVLSALDVNKDGRMSFAEFVQIYEQDRSILATAWRKAQMEAAAHIVDNAGTAESDVAGYVLVFASLDTERTGFVSEAQLAPLLREAARTTHPRWSSSDVDRHVRLGFKNADIDQDGLLSLDEWLRAFRSGERLLPERAVRAIVDKRSLLRARMAAEADDDTEALLSYAALRYQTSHLQPSSTPSTVVAATNGAAAPNGEAGSSTGAEPTAAADVSPQKIIEAAAAATRSSTRRSLHVDLDIPPALAPDEAADEILRRITATQMQRVRETHALTHIFASMDSNSDGFLTLSEMKAALVPALQAVHPGCKDQWCDAMIRTQLALSDDDRDGRLSLAEFMRTYLPAMPLTVAAAAAAVGPSRATSPNLADAAAAAILTSAREGQSEEELLAVPLAVVVRAGELLSGRKLSQQERDQLLLAFRSIDTRNTGCITTGELTKLLQETLRERFDSQEAIAEAVRCVMSHVPHRDTDKITFAEFLAAFEGTPQVLQLPLLAVSERIQKAETALSTILVDDEMRRIARVFVDLDANRDGVVSYDDLHDEMFRTMARFNPDWDAQTIESAVRRVFDAADVNKDGVLNLEEFIHSFTTKHYVLPPSWIMERDTRMTRRLTSEEIDELRDIFRSIDTNKDGYLTLEELETLLRDSLDDTMAGDTANVNAIVAAVIALVDKDNDGCIAFTDFVDAYERDATVLDIPIMAAAARREMAERQLEVMLCEHDLRDLAKVFLHLDRDGDGYIEPGELRSAMANGLSKAHPDWADNKIQDAIKSLLTSADVAEDGRLSLDEFIKTFVAGHYMLPPQYVKDVAATMSRQLTPEEEGTVRDIFARIDSEERGYITAEELRRTIAEAVGDDVAAAVCKAVMLVAEAQDGKLSLEEFLKCYQIDQGLLYVPINRLSEQTAERIARSVDAGIVRDAARVFHAIDSKHDGVLDLDELADAMLEYPSLNSTVQDRTGAEAQLKARLMAMADLAGSGALGLDEFVATFAGGRSSLMPAGFLDAALEALGPASPIAQEARRRSAEDATPVPVAVVPPVAEAAPATPGRNSTSAEEQDIDPNAGNGGGSPGQPEAGEELTSAVTPKSRVLSAPADHMSPPGQRILSQQALNDVSLSPVTDRELRGKFQALDVNSDGTIDFIEFNKAYLNLEYYGLVPTEREVRRLFNTYADQQQRISYDAFCILVLRHSKM